MAQIAMITATSAGVTPQLATLVKSAVLYTVPNDITDRLMSVHIVPEGGSADVVIYVNDRQLHKVAPFSLVNLADNHFYLNAADEIKIAHTDGSGPWWLEYYFAFLEKE